MWLRERERERERERVIQRVCCELGDDLNNFLRQKKTIFAIKKKEIERD